MTKQQRIITAMQNKIYRYQREMETNLHKFVGFPFCCISVLGKPVPVYSGRLEYVGENIFKVSDKEFSADDILDIYLEDSSIHMLLAK